jgi:hypothetical protein
MRNYEFCHLCTYHSVSLSLKSSPSEEPPTLGFLEGGREFARDCGRDDGREPVGETIGEELMDADTRRALAFRDMVLPFSRACRRKPPPYIVARF